MPNSKARLEAAALVGVVFLLGISLGGVANHLWGQRVWGMRNELATTAPQSRLDDQLTEELQLTADQQKQLRGITAEAQAKWRELYSPLESRRSEIREQSHEQMRGILTPEQQPKFDAFMQRLAEQRKREAARSAIPAPAR
jgi:Spy/CpxP family protein refolding chaperone